MRNVANKMTGDAPSRERWGIKTPRPAAPCMICGADLARYRYYSTYLCDECKAKQPHGIAGADALRMVALAVKQGYLKPVKECICVDCGAPARAYDHRDYNKPLEVEPVCYRCNKIRGPAIPRRFELKTEAA